MKHSSDVEYIGALARDLHRLAVRARKPLLAYLLSLVIAASEEI